MLQTTTRAIDVSVATAAVDLSHISGAVDTD
jgi:hypothetical protein